MVDKFGQASCLPSTVIYCFRAAAVSSFYSRMEKRDMEINGGHPFWGIVRMAVFFVGLTVFLYLNATNFDRGEITTIVELLIVAGGFEAVRHHMLKNGKKPESD